MEYLRRVMSEHEYRDWIAYLSEREREEYEKLNQPDKEDWRNAWLIYHVVSLVSKNPGHVEDYLLKFTAPETPEQKRNRVMNALKSWKAQYDSKLNSEGPDAHRHTGH